MNSNITGSKALSVAKMGLFMIANAMIVHEALVSSGVVKNVNPLSQISQVDPAGWLISEWNKILNTNYGMVFEPAIKLLKSLPSHPTLKRLLIDISNVARKAVANRAIFKHDLAGRLYHKLLLKKIAKGLATYYTSIPAATILSSLAIDHVSVKWSDIEDTSKLRVADYACGSGTLLSAVYSEIMDRHIVNARNKPSIRKLHKVLLENVLYGFDVLEYAVHLTTASLVLRDPAQILTHTNTYVVPLGVMNSKVYLGSLNLEVIQDKVVFPIVKTLIGTTTQPVIKEGIDTAIKSVSLEMEKPHIVIMNPPFARTGNVGKSSLFGYLPKAERKEVLEELKQLGRKIAERYNLSKGFGRAGLAAYFLVKSYETLRDNGVLAFVLPRVFLSGTDWSSIREFIAKKCTIRYIIVSDDPQVFWAWSENTNLSEILMVCTKKPSNEYDTLTVVYVRKRPRSALEAKMYTRLMKAEAENLTINPGNCFSPTSEVRINNETIMYLYKICSSGVKLIAGTNLNIAVGFHSSFLSEIAFDIYINKTFLGYRLPLIPLKDYVKMKIGCSDWEKCVGYDVSAIQKTCLGQGNIYVPYLDALNMNTFSSLKLPQEVLKKARVPNKCVERAGRLLIAGTGRMRLTTIGVVGTYYDDPVLSQVAWTIPLDQDDAKIQTLWLNTTPGLIHFLSLRQDSAGGFVQFKKKSLGDLLLIDTNKLSQEARTNLLQLFNTFSGTRFGRIYTQLKEASNCSGIRFNLDTNFMNILGIPVNNNVLVKIYKELLEETILRP